MNEKTRKFLFVAMAVIVLAGFYVLATVIPNDALTNLGGSIPLPLFTLIIAFIDGFNPCNLFILTLLISLMLSESHSRKRIFAVGYSFVGVVYVFYFLFMAAWLNIFQYMGFIDPLRIAIAIIAIIAGLINCKELFFYRKGITLMIQDKNVGPLKKRINKVAELIKKGKMKTLIGASIVLAIFSSLVELPCTAGFPIIYTGILEEGKATSSPTTVVSSAPAMPGATADRSAEPEFAIAPNASITPQTVPSSPRNGPVLTAVASSPIRLSRFSAASASVQSTTVRIFSS